MRWIRRQRMSFFTDGSAPAGTGFWPSYRHRDDPKGSGEEKTSLCTKLGPRPFLVQFPWRRDGLTKWLHNQSIFRELYRIMGFPDGSSGKESVYRRWGFIPGFWKDPLEKEMATQSSILAWEIPWKEEPGGLQSVGSQSIRHKSVTQHMQNNTEGLVIRTVKEVVGRFIFWSMRRFMPHFYFNFSCPMSVYERRPIAEEGLSDGLDKRNCYSIVF